MEARKLKARRKVNNSKKTFYLKLRFSLDGESLHSPASVRSSQVRQWRQRDGDKIKQVKEEVHSCAVVLHVPNIWRQGEGKEKEKRQVHLWAGSPDEPLKGVRPFVLSCVFSSQGRRQRRLWVREGGENQEEEGKSKKEKGGIAS